ncbi:MAG: M3 family oligoendopeptidase [Thermomicrobiales bacterium]|nr:M3 family oligoendopeptidase [Thermomicrobiales bacterium]
MPRWDLAVLYPALESPEFAAGFADVVDRIAALGDLFDAEGVGAGPPQPLDEALVARFDRIVVALNATLEAVAVMTAYLSGLVTTDSRDETAQARFSELHERGVSLTKLMVRWDAWVGRLDVSGLIARSPVAAAHGFALRKAQIAARHQMPAAEEALAAELGPAGGTAWSKLYDNVTSQLLVELEVDGERRRLPMSEVRNLAMSPRRDVRQRAYRAELAAWSDWATPLAAALNGVKGQTVVLSQRRGWVEPLDAALFVNNVDRSTLEAMIAAARDAFPDLRRYLKAKAAALGLPALAWWDLFAPVGEGGRSWEWDAAVAFLDDRFGAFSVRLRDLLRRAVAERWIDAGPRPGKTGGAYCMRLRDGESRILHNFTPGYDGVSTLAHELGHAYHNLNETGLAPLQRETPMTLAETASTFCETIVREAALADADRAGQRFILEQSLQGSCQIVVDIVSRFDFERAVFAKRREREVTVSELCALMERAQTETYGDGLDPATYHQFMWAAKGHYYIDNYAFYNFPYLFGLLFGLGLYARYRADPTGFQTAYDALLASTGQSDAADLAARWGIDLRDKAFWESSLDVIRADVDRFVALVGEG